MKDVRDDSDVGKQSRRSRFARLQRCLFLGCVAIQTSSNNNPLAISVRRTRRRIEAKSENYTNEPLYEQQSWSFETIKLKYAWNLGYTGENVTVRMDDPEIWEWNQSQVGDDQWLEFYKQNNATTIQVETENYSCGLPWEETNTTTETIEAPNHISASAASILAANGTNNFCGVGIAPSSQVSFCKYQEVNSSETIPIYRFLEDANQTTNVTNDNTTLLDENQTIDESIEDDSFDISINAFAYQACTALSKTVPGVHFPPPNASIPMQPVNNNVHQLGDCPFGNFFKKDGYKSPCMVCTKEDFEAVKKGARDNVFETASVIKEKDNPYRSGRSTVSDECSTSVREYCLRNFEDDEGLCTNWIDVINRGNICSFQSNVGIHRHHLMQHGANKGRKGRGTIYIIPAGDTYQYADDVNYQALPKSRFAMTVGAIDMSNVTDGNNVYYMEPKQTRYSTTGSSIFVVAPGGDHKSSFNPIAATGGGGTCEEAGFGTAYAAPVVGGVVALMLEAYPGATWRDIRAIIVETSKPVILRGYMGRNLDTTYGINSAQVGYSDHFGFGLINARTAVQKAKNWGRKDKHTFPDVGITASSGPLNFDIYDDSFSTTVSTIEVNDTRFEDGGEITAESISVYLKLRYFNRGNLRITLRSPAGTTSTLSPGGRNDYGQLQCGEWWEFITLRSWGENPNGVWKLSITDTKSGNGGASCIDRPAGKLGLDMTCHDYEVEGLCSGGTVQMLPDDMFNSMLFAQSYGRCNMNASSACCACGGGIKPNDLDVISGQLEEWKIVLGDGGNPYLDVEPIHFFDQEYWSNITLPPEVNETNATTIAPTRIETMVPSMSPSMVPTIPTIAPIAPTPVPMWATYKPVERTSILPDPKEEIKGFQGIMNRITNFVAGLFTGGNNSCEPDAIDCEGSKTSKVSSVFAWIITFGFSILLLIRGTSLCDLHINFGGRASSRHDNDDDDDDDRRGRYRRDRRWI